MEISVDLEQGLLPDRFGKFAAKADMADGHPARSFPIEIRSVPTEAKTLALTFVDFDSIPVCGFCWIHWLACNLPANVTRIPENASALASVAMVQGSNSDWSPLAGGHEDPAIIHRYAGPYPPDCTHSYTLTLYALDCELELQEGFFMNELLHVMAGHILDSASIELPSRAF